MEAIIFCGIQATGKSSFFKERFFGTHMHISLDQLNTRNREGHFLETCFKHSRHLWWTIPILTAAERKKYIDLARLHQFKTVGYYFQSRIEDALLRNNTRKEKAYIPEIGIKGTYARLEIPDLAEGFDELYYVTIGENGFTVKPWKNEI